MEKNSQKWTANLYNTKCEGFSPRGLNLEVYFYFLGSVSSVYKRQKTLLTAIATAESSGTKREKGTLGTNKLKLEITPTFVKR